MKLEGKKQLAARALNVGSGRVVFNINRLSDIKEAITKQDIKDLQNSGAIMINDKKGRRKVQKRKTRRRAGSIRMKVNTRKKDYATLTRKLRTHLVNLKARDKISRDQHETLKKEVRASNFRSLAHMKERVGSLE